MKSSLLEKAIVLPKPEITREQCVEACTGCNKMYSNDSVGDVCIAYVSPSRQHKLFECTLKSNRNFGIETKKKINPLKASKRAKKASKK